jgi:hypothetical protein
MSKIIQLKTKVLSSTGEDYTVHLLVRDDIGRTSLSIIPAKGTAGAWSWYLETLMGVGAFSNGGPSDELSLDFGQNWSVTGMLEVYKEILNEVIK